MMLVLQVCDCINQKDYFDSLMPLFSAIVTAFFMYWFGIKGKKKDILNEQTKELNIVLSDMLNTRYYLQKINELLKISIDTSDDLILPKKYVPFFALTSGTLNDSCFSQLENSIDKLKAYDPIAYYNLEGIGSRFDFFKNSFIIPFLKSSNENSSPLDSISSKMLDDLSNEMDNYLRKTSKLISKETNKKVENIIINNYFIDVNNMIEEYNKEYYNCVLTLFPKDKEKPSYDEFKKEFKSTEVQEHLKKEFELMQNEGIEKMVTIISANQALTIEELEYKLEELRNT